MNYQKGVIPVVVAIILALFIGGGAFYAVQQEKVKREKGEKAIDELIEQSKNSPKLKEKTFNNETADWKTYKNEKYGFEFKYPVGWVVDEGVLYSSWPTLQLGITKDNNPPMGLAISISPIREVERCGKRKRGEIIINGITSEKCGHTYPTDGYTTDTMGKEYSFRFVCNFNAIVREIDCDQVIASFKLTNDQTSNWKTYKNEKYGFEFKYPVELKVEELARSGAQHIYLKNNSQEFVRIIANIPALGFEGSVLVKDVPVTVDGKMEKIEILRSADGSYLTHAVINKNDVTYYLSASNKNATVEEKTELLKTILSTFKFTK